MKIAINNLEYVKKLNKEDIIYVFEEETLEELLNTNLHCVRKECIEYVDINLTDYDIPCIKKCTINDDLTLPPKKNYKIGIIIPNCNYEEHIEKCLNSILNQKYNNYEIVFVDDMSTDNSVNIAKRLLKTPHKVIELKQKRLNGGARNEAYLHLSDDVDYVWYVDSDDWIKENALEEINDRLQTNPDVIFIGMAQYSNGDETISFIPEYQDKYQAFLGWSGSCGKVIKKELATKQECLYNEGTLKEDKNQHCRICINMRSFINIKKPLYVWNRSNTKSVTTARDSITWKASTIRHYADTWELKQKEFGKDIIIDKLLAERLEKTKNEMESGGDRQF